MTAASTQGRTIRLAWGDPQRVATWVWRLSWTFWLALALGVALAGATVMAHHRTTLKAGRFLGHMQFLMCKRYAAPPRPAWQECLLRSTDDEGNVQLLAPATGESLAPDALN